MPSRRKRQPAVRDAALPGPSGTQGAFLRLREREAHCGEMSPTVEQCGLPTMSRAFAVFGLLAAVAAGPAQAQLDKRLAFFARQLQKASDPRVRAQNALALGLSQEPAALGPLCVALNDKSD